MSTSSTIRDSFFGEDGYKAVDIPVLFMTGSEDKPDAAQSDYDSVEGIDFRWLELDGACHETFGYGECRTLDPGLGFEIVGAYALAFGRTVVLQDESSSLSDWLSGAEKPYAEAEMRVKN